jgi:HAE1 family hydrophobic/amphiphilic exporter-1
MFVATKPSDKRRGKGHSAAEIVADLNAQAADAAVCAQWRVWWPCLSRRRCRAWAAFGGFTFMLQDTGRNTLSDLDRVAHQIVGASAAQQDLVGLLTQLLRQRSAGTGDD